MLLKVKLLFLQTVGTILKKLNRGTSLVGYLDEKLNLNVLKDVSYENKKVIFVVGTNGKTSITNLIYDLLIAENKTVLSNLEGANMVSGIKTTLIMNLKKNKLKQDVILFEVDEKNLKYVAKLVKPNEIILTNFFRDQLDRYFEISIVVEEIMQTIKEYKIKTYYNGQDALLYKYLKDVDVEQVKYSLDKIKNCFTKQDSIVEIKYCPNCLTKLEYEYYHYSHIGEFSCPNCEFNVNNIKYKFSIENSKLICNEEICLNLKKDLPQYILINYCLVLNFVLENEYSLENFQKIIDNEKEIKGRNNNIKYKNKEIYFNLAKNVAGMEQTIAKLVKENKKIDLLIVLNDNLADGRDVSWIWDTHFEKLIPLLNTLHITGTRKGDMKLRFLYENYENINEYNAINEALDAIVKEKNPKIVCNYTPLKEINNYFKDK